MLTKHSLFLSWLSETVCACLYSQTQEREEDQRILNLVGDALRLLGNTLVVLSDLRCNLATSPPRHLYVVRPMAHYTHPVLLQAGLPHMPIPVGQHHTDLLCEIIDDLYQLWGKKMLMLKESICNKITLIWVERVMKFRVSSCHLLGLIWYDVSFCFLVVFLDV